jgi:AcrR family transcriptional regulator
MPVAKHNIQGRARRGADKSSARQRIIAGARGHFFAHGFRGVTMDDLAQELGMSKKTLYANFPSKSALLQAVLDDKFREVNEELGQVTSGNLPDIVSTLRCLLIAVQKQVQEIQPPFVRDIHRHAPEVFKMIQARRSKMIEFHFGRVLSEGRRKGIIRKDIPARLMIEILLGTIDSIMNPTKIMELDLIPDTALSTILMIFFHGVTVEPNRPKP